MTKATKESRDIMSVEISPQARIDMATALKKLRLSKKDLVASILSWFVKQEHEVQALITETLPTRFVAEAKRELTKSLMGHTKGGRFDGDVKGKSGTPE